MSLSRAAFAVARAKPASTYLQRGLASSSAHDEHHYDDHHQDSAQYPKEGFTSKGWAYTVAAGLATVAFYKYAPAPGEENYITRYIEYYQTPRELWERINNHHLAISHDASEAKLLIDDAKRPPVHRYRYPQSFDTASPFLIPVGGQVDLSDLKVKGDKDL